MNYNIILQDGGHSYNLNLLETKEKSDCIIAGRNFKLSLDGTSASLAQAKIRLSQIDTQSPISLGKLYATLLNVSEENLNIDSKYLTLESIREVAIHVLSNGTPITVTAKDPLQALIEQQFLPKETIWRNKTIKKIDEIQTKFKKNVEESEKFVRTIDESTWKYLSFFEKANFVASNAFSLGALSFEEQQKVLNSRIKDCKIELLKVLYQAHQLIPVSGEESKRNEQLRIEQMLEVAITIEQIAFARDLFPQVEHVSPYFLFLSVLANSGEFIELMIEKGIDPNSLNKLGHSPLYIACLRGANEAVEILLKNNANPNLIQENGKNSILHKAISSSGLTMETLKLLLQKTDNINIRDTEGKSLLHGAVLYGNMYGDMQRIDLLLDKKIGVNIQDKEGRTALHYAIENDQKHCLEIVKKLIQANVQVDISDLYSRTALHYAARHSVSDEVDDGELVKALFEAGAAVNAQDYEGKTPLHYAVGGGMEGSNTNTVSELIKHGSDLNIQDEEGNTPLHLAIDMGHIELVKLLLESGADRNIRNKQGYLPGAMATNSYFCTDEKIEKILALLTKPER